MKGLRNVGYVTVSLMFLVACGTPVEDDVTQKPSPKLVEVSSEKETTEEDETASVKPVTAPETEAPKEILKEPIDEQEPEFQIPPATVLNGKTTDEILAVFGKPVLLREDEPAQIWQYLTSKCALHIVFYAEGDAAPVVTYVAMNDRVKALSVDEKDCFKSQLQRIGFERAKALS
jgi:hypothetical protein